MKSLKTSTVAVCDKYTTGVPQHNSLLRRIPAIKVAALVTALFLSLPGHAQVFVPVPLSGVANGVMTEACVDYPTGDVILGGVPFSIPTLGNNIWYPFPPMTHLGGVGIRSVTIPVERSGVTGIHTLINTFWGTGGPQSFASLVFTYTDTTVVEKNLIGNVNIRDYLQGFFTNSINGTTSTNVFSAFSSGLGGSDIIYRIDKQFVDLSAFADKTLATVTLIDTGAPDVQRTILFGVTAEVAAPEPGTLGLALPILFSGWIARRQRRG